MRLVYYSFLEVGLPLYITFFLAVETSEYKYRIYKYKVKQTLEIQNCLKSLPKLCK